MYAGRNSGGGGSDLYLQGGESGCACLVERVEVIHLGNVDEVGLHFSFLSVFLKYCKCLSISISKVCISLTGLYPCSTQTRNDLSLNQRQAISRIITIFIP